MLELRVVPHPWHKRPTEVMQRNTTQRNATYSAKDGSTIHHSTCQSIETRAGYGRTGSVCLYYRVQVYSIQLHLATGFP